MKITVHRTLFTDKQTCGELSVDGVYFCHTLEDKVRIDNPATPQNEGAKVWGETAISAGVYKLIIRMSQRFKRLMMALLDVPDFTGILIHSGNTEVDTHGCILVGYKLDDAHHIAPGTSRIAADKLFELVSAAIARGEEVTVEVLNA